jgi:hypothetical protein
VYVGHTVSSEVLGRLGLSVAANWGAVLQISARQNNALQARTADARTACQLYSPSVICWCARVDGILWLPQVLSDLVRDLSSDNFINLHSRAHS